MTTFLNKVKTDKPAIYHILDGFLAEGIDGYSQKFVNNYLRDNRLNDFSNGKKVILYNHIDIFSILDDIHKNDVSIFNIYMMTLKGGHALSLLIYYKNSEYHIFLINSGFGINQFESNKSRMGDMMIPFDYYIINDNNIMTLLEVIEILNSGNNIDSISSVSLIREDLYNIIKPYLKDDIEWTNIESEYRPTHRYLEVNLIEKPYYYMNIIHDILGNTTEFNPVEFTGDIIWADTNTILDDEFKSSNISLSYNEFVKKKLCFHKNFEVIPQQQGTCTWFCKYWALLIACILLNGDYSEYINRVYKCAINKLIEMLLPDDNKTFVSKITLETKLKNLGIITFNKDAKFINKTLKMSLPITELRPPQKLIAPLESLKQIIILLSEKNVNNIIIIVKFILKYPDFDPKSVLFKKFPDIETFSRTITNYMTSEYYLVQFLYLKKMYDKIIEIENSDDIYLLQIQILYIIIFFYTDNFYDTRMIKKMVINYYYVAIYINICILYFDIYYKYDDTLNKYNKVLSQ